MKELKNDRDVLQALLDGKIIQDKDNAGNVIEEIYLTDTQLRRFDTYSREDTFYFRGNYNTKPKTININGYEVPEPLRKEPEALTICYHAFVGLEPYKFKYNPQDTNQALWLKMGLLHLNYENAHLHRKALVSFTTLEKKA